MFAQTHFHPFSWFAEVGLYHTIYLHKKCSIFIQNKTELSDAHTHTHTQHLCLVKEIPLLEMHTSAISWQVFMFMWRSIWAFYFIFKADSWSEVLLSVITRITWSARLHDYAVNYASQALRFAVLQLGNSKTQWAVIGYMRWQISFYLHLQVETNNCIKSFKDMSQNLTFYSNWVD